MKHLLALFVLSFSLNASATHIAAGEMYYDYLGNNNYEIHLLLYRDCSTLVQFDSPLHLTVFDQANNVIQEVAAPFIATDVQLVDYSTLPNPSCVSQFPGACLEYYTYSVIVNLPPINGGYLLSYQRCCLASTLLNIDTPNELGYTFTSTIPGLETGKYENSSPRFQGHSLFLGCTNELTNFNHVATDPDGDDLVYSIITPKGFDLGASNYMPNPEMPPPYPPLPYEIGFSEQDPLGSGGILTINSATGEMAIQPVSVGHFAIGVKVDEYKAGNLISSTFRYLDMQVATGSVGVEENNSINQFSVYPNPAVNEVEINSKVEHSLIIFTADGKELFNYDQYAQGTYTIDMTAFESGVYYFQFESNLGREIKAIFKQEI